MAASHRAPRARAAGDPALDDADRRWMTRALRSARAAAGRGEIPVGAIVTREEGPVATGANRTVADHDPSAHAEVVALRRAGRRLGNHRLPGCTLYVTLEPCPMCLGAMIQARIRRLVYGAEDPKGGGVWLLDLDGFRAKVNHRFEVKGGVLDREASVLLGEFFRTRRRRVRGSNPKT